MSKWFEIVTLCNSFSLMLLKVINNEIMQATIIVLNLMISFLCIVGMQEAEMKLTQRIGKIENKGK